MFFFIAVASDFAGYMSSLPPAVHPHLEHQLDRDSGGVDRDLSEIAHHMLDWEVQLSTHLKLTEVDISDVKEKHSKEPELQRCEIKLPLVFFGVELSSPLFAGVRH